MKRIVASAVIGLFLLVGVAPASAGPGIGEGYSLGLELGNTTTETSLNKPVVLLSHTDQTGSQKQELTDTQIALEVWSAMVKGTIPVMENRLELDLGIGIVGVTPEVTGAKLKNNSVSSSRGVTSTSQWNSLSGSLGDDNEAKGHVFSLGGRLKLCEPSEISSVYVSASARYWKVAGANIALIDNASDNSSQYPGGTYSFQRSQLTEINDIEGRELVAGLYYKSKVTETILVSFGGIYGQYKYEFKGSTIYGNNGIDSRTDFKFQTSAQGPSVVATVDWEMSPNVVMGINVKAVGPQTGATIQITRLF